jgi:hypothetical protein
MSFRVWAMALKSGKNPERGEIPESGAFIGTLIAYIKAAILAIPIQGD